MRMGIGTNSCEFLSLSAFSGEGRGEWAAPRTRYVESAPQLARILRWDPTSLRMRGEVIRNRFDGCSECQKQAEDSAHVLAAGRS